MKALPAHPSLYQINTRVWLTELFKSLGRKKVGPALKQNPKGIARIV